MTNFRNIVQYFDLQSVAREYRLESYDSVKDRTSLPVLPQYLALVAGIAVQPFLAVFQETRRWDLSGWQGWVPFSLIVGLIIFPGIYKRSFDPEKNLFVQLCAVFASGLGWQSLLATAATVAKVK
jgi:hypothetical protein